SAVALDPGGDPEAVARQGRGFQEIPPVGASAHEKLLPSGIENGRGVAAPRARADRVGRCWVGVSLRRPQTGRHQKTKSEIRNWKSETNPKSRSPNSEPRCFGHWDFGDWGLFRIS